MKWANLRIHQISERMDESMVLLADALCVPLEEVTSLKNNARRKDKVRRTLAEHF